MGALNAEKVPLPARALRLAVVAHNINHALQILRHGVLRNVPRAGFPRRRHALLAHDRFLANRAAVVESCEFSKAVRVNRVAAGQILGRLARGEHVFAADWTVVLVLVLEALV